MLLLRQFLLVTGLVLIAAFGSWSLWRRFAPDETRIRWRLEEMAAGFCDGDLGPIVAGLSADFRDESSGHTRTDVRQLLASLFFREIDPATKRFRLRVELADPGEIVVEDTEPQHVELELAARFYERKGEVEGVFWDATFHARLEERDGAWLVVHTSKVNHYERGDLR